MSQIGKIVTGILISMLVLLYFGYIEQNRIQKIIDSIEHKPNHLSKSNTLMNDLDGIWRQSDEFFSRKINIQGNNYTFTKSMMGQNDENSGRLKRFKAQSKNAFGEEITLDAIQLLDQPNEPILWLDPEKNELQAPWTWSGTVKYSKKGYWNGLIFKKD